MKPLIKQKKGAIFDIIVFVVVAFIIVAFLGIWLYGHDILTSTLTGITAPVGNGSDTVGSIASSTIGAVDSSEGTWLPIIAFALIFGMALTIFISAYFVRTHPVFIIPYIFFILLAVVVSVYVSNAYDDIFISDANFGAEFQNMSAVTFILLNLPVWTTVIGFIGILILFANLGRDNEIQGGIV